MNLIIGCIIAQSLSPVNPGEIADIPGLFPEKLVTILCAYPLLSAKRRFCQLPPPLQRRNAALAEQSRYSLVFHEVHPNWMKGSQCLPWLLSAKQGEKATIIGWKQPITKYITAKQIKPTTITATITTTTTITATTTIATTNTITNTNTKTNTAQRGGQAAVYFFFFYFRNTA